MRLNDLKFGYTWVIGVQGFDSAIFVQHNITFGKFQWTENLLDAKTFKNKTEANECINNNAYMRKLLMNSVPKFKNMVRPIKVALRVGV